MWNLDQLSHLVAHKQTLAGVNVECYVCSYEANAAFPKKFAYFGCIQEKGDDQVCKVSVEGRENDRCLHNAAALGRTAAFYRFAIHITDHSIPSRSTRFITAKIWDEAEKLLRVFAGQLRSMDAAGQFEILQCAIASSPYCRLQLKLLWGEVTVTSLHILSRNGEEPRRTASTFPYNIGLSPSRLGHTYRTGTLPRTRGNIVGSSSTKYAPPTDYGLKFKGDYGVKFEGQEDVTEEEAFEDPIGELAAEEPKRSTWEWLLSVLVDILHAIAEILDRRGLAGKN